MVQDKPHQWLILDGTLNCTVRKFLLVDPTFAGINLMKIAL
jgi:hypothetical protein